MKICKSPQFPDDRAWFQSGFADGWSKPHPYGIDGAFFAQPTARSTQRVGGVMTPPYDGLPCKRQFIGLVGETDKHIGYFMCSWAEKLWGSSSDRGTGSMEPAAPTR